MDTNEVAAVVVAAASVLGVVVLVFALVTMVRTLNAMGAAVESIRAETLPVVRDLQSTVSKANGELERVDELLVNAESISGTVDSASRLLYLAMSNPLIKVMAFATGTSRAARRLRRLR
ncbi:hypothetical protein BH20ACT2_BH20ACT2_21830 [soil metagenome]